MSQSQLFHLTCNEKSATLEVFEDGMFEFYGYDPEDDMIANEMGFVVDSDCWYIWDAICQETVTPALSDAVQRKNIVLLKALLALGADVNDDCNLPLASAASDGWLEAVDLFLEAGACPNDPESDFPPLVIAAYKGHAHIVKYLLEYGGFDASVGEALVAASEKGQGSVVNVLLHLANTELIDEVIDKAIDAAEEWRYPVASDLRTWRDNKELWMSYYL